MYWNGKTKKKGGAGGNTRNNEDNKPLQKGTKNKKKSKKEQQIADQKEFIYGLNATMKEQSAIKRLSSNNLRSSNPVMFCPRSGGMMGFDEESEVDIETMTSIIQATSKKNNKNLLMEADQMSSSSSDGITVIENPKPKKRVKLDRTGNCLHLY